jgi:hypothetical protein
MLSAKNDRPQFEAIHKAAMRDSPTVLIAYLLQTGRASDADHELMRRIDELHFQYPFTGSRMLRGLCLSRKGIQLGAGMHAN